MISSSSYLRFVLCAAAATLALVLLGIAPTRQLSGDGAVPALVAGCSISLLASVVGGLPQLLGRQGAAAVNALLGTVLLRLVIVALLGAVAALSGRFELVPLLLWVAISYCLLLAVDTAFAVRWNRTAVPLEER